MSFSRLQHKGMWARVTRSNPCVICERPDWCIISPDRTVYGCLRVEQGCFRSKQDKNGTTIYFHRPFGDMRREPLPVLTAEGRRARGVSPDVLHTVYTALLSSLSLTDRHALNLRRRGLTEQVIRRNRYRTLPVYGRPRITGGLLDRFGDRLLQVPGFVVKENERGPYYTIAGWAGMLIPVRDLRGRVIALKVRRDEVDGGPRYLYLSSRKYRGPGPGSPVHISLGIQAPTELVRITEGELKADVATFLSSVPTISAPGVTSWRRCLAVLGKLGCKTARLAFDADACTNPIVARALLDCADALVAAGYRFQLEAWDAASGKGIDDVLAAAKGIEESLPHLS